MKIIHQQIIKSKNLNGEEVIVWTDKLCFTEPTPQFLATLSGTDEEKLIYIANKDLPTGTKYEIITDEATILGGEDRSLFNYVSGSNEKISENL